MKVNESDEQASLQQYKIKYACKKFYSKGTWASLFREWKKNMATNNVIIEKINH
jgi:hypothetical protein